MAIQFTGDANHPESSTLEYVGRVLSVEPWSYHVPSDNAMIDSGDGQQITVFDKGRVRHHFIQVGRPLCGYYSNTIDATPEVREQASRSIRFYGWLARVRIAYSNQQKAVVEGKKVVKGSKVEVYKGRKVPKGTYYVRVLGLGQYGPYISLSTNANGTGAFHRYVNPENCQVIDVPTPELIWPEELFPLTDTLRTLALEWAGLSGYGVELEAKEVEMLPALHDALLDAGQDEWAEVVGWALQEEEPHPFEATSTTSTPT